MCAGAGQRDLGANFVGSYSFYLLGSPFFWLTIPFPSKAVPYLMAPLLMLKFACAALAGFTFLRRYVRREESAILGALLYAFSGFSIYNVFFNHFHEAIISFPFLLAALDEYMYTRRRGVFALAVFACCFVNYYFFVGQVTFCLILLVSAHVQPKLGNPPARFSPAVFRSGRRRPAFLCSSDSLSACGPAKSAGEQRADGMECTDLQ